ncbi:poly(A)-specific ribonuclease PNLDC1 isoform X4 [Tyto alba]|uniref:poly(A)-specific ribonuclease PNLDC1 isoform X4 n=1 Tax=Tyto alba TaxID=56313 RepID=UPI001C679196|nr:poly(A)-specific ribonuclease PNLDC1 isoform X4 [Tyto alba]
MEVGAACFERCLPRLRGRIGRADFLALDMEFTGLHSTVPQNDKPSLFDSPAERYPKARQSVQRFTVAQLGLAIFSKKNSNKYVVHSYNFLLFPSTLGVTDVELTFSASSIQFLSRYGFDYNKFLRDGIPYMNEAQEKILSQHLLAGSCKVSSSMDRDVLKKAIDKVTCWIAAAEEEETMVLQDLSGCQVFEIQLVLRQALQNVWTQPLGYKKVMVKKVSPQHRRLLENSPYDSCQKELILLSARGFTNLFQTLVKAKKPLVGHNMLMDLMHLHDKFYNPLPESYQEFKRNIHNLFPVLIDTKTVTKSIWKKCPFPRVSNLLEVYEVLCSSSEVSSFATAQIHRNFSGEDVPCQHPPLLVVHVQGWPELNERQIYEEFKDLCRFDVRRLSKNQFILLSNKFKHVRLVLQNYKNHPHLRISVYRYWRHSPQVNCLLQVSGIVALWSLLAFVLGGAPSCSL